MGYLFVFAILSSSALYLWHSKDLQVFHARREALWIMATSTVVLGGVSFALDTLIAGGLSAATHLGTPLGFGLTLIICPGLTMVAVSSLARSFLLPRTGQH